MTQDFNKRTGKRNDIIALFQSKPLQWIGVHELAHVGGFAAWRTRVSEARQELEKSGGSVEWNEDCRESAYRFLPYVPLGRAADVEPSDQPALFDLGVR